jgi:hypothetical protein
MNLGDLKLVGRCVAADRQYDERGPADAARNGRLKVLQRHGIEVSIVPRREIANWRGRLLTAAARSRNGGSSRTLARSYPTVWSTTGQAETRPPNDAASLSSHRQTVGVSIL